MPLVITVYILTPKLHSRKTYLPTIPDPGNGDEQYVLLLR